MVTIPHGARWAPGVYRHAAPHVREPSVHYACCARIVRSTGGYSKDANMAGIDTRCEAGRCDHWNMTGIQREKVKRETSCGKVSLERAETLMESGARHPAELLEIVDDAIGRTFSPGTSRHQPGRRRQGHPPPRDTFRRHPHPSTRSEPPHDRQETTHPEQRHPGSPGQRGSSSLTAVNYSL